MASNAGPATTPLIAILDEAFDARAWHGPTLRRAVRGVTARQAAWRPGPRRHNIWELTVHAAYWKHEARRRLERALQKYGTTKITKITKTTATRDAEFPYRGANWFEANGQASWSDAVRLLNTEHRKLRATVASLPPRALGARVRGRDTAAFTIRGIAAHDLYHAGQIQLLRRLQK